MMKYSFIIIGLFTLISCGSQYKQKLFYKNMSCVKKDKLTVSERNKIYPYNFFLLPSIIKFNPFKIKV